MDTREYNCGGVILIEARGEQGKCTGCYFDALPNCGIIKAEYGIPQCSVWFEREDRIWVGKVVKSDIEIARILNKQRNK